MTVLPRRDHTTCARRTRPRGSCARRTSNFLLIPPAKARCAQKPPLATHKREAHKATTSKRYTSAMRTTIRERLHEMQKTLECHPSETYTYHHCVHSCKRCVKTALTTSHHSLAAVPCRTRAREGGKYGTKTSLTGPRTSCARDPAPQAGQDA